MFFLVSPCFSVLFHVFPCCRMFFRVFLCFPLILPVFPCVSTFSAVFPCFSIFFLDSPCFSSVLPCFPCFPWFSSVFLWFPLFSHVCFSLFSCHCYFWENMNNHSTLNVCLFVCFSIGCVVAWLVYFRDLKKEPPPPQLHSPTNLEWRDGALWLQYCGFILDYASCAVAFNSVQGCLRV